MPNNDELLARVGEVVREATLPVEAGKVKEFAWAIGDSSPVYLDAAAAQSAGFDGIPSPPTFSVVAGLYAGGNSADLPRQLGLDLQRVVHGEQTWKYYRTPIVGEVLQSVSRLANITSRKNRGGLQMRFVTIKTEFIDQQGKPVIDEEMVMIEMPKSAESGSGTDPKQLST